jgi:hypothetical protein
MILRCARSAHARHAAPGQALALVAAVLGLLVALAVGVVDVAAQRRAVRIAQHAAEHAALVGLRAVRPESLAANAPALDAARAEATARRALAIRLEPLAPWLVDSPEATAARAEVRAAAAGETVCGMDAPGGPAMCVRGDLRVRSVLGGVRTYAFATVQVYASDLSRRQSD